MNPKTKKVDKNYIGVGQKILAVLEHFVDKGARQHPVPFHEVSTALSLPRTTVHRILYTLEKLGYVEKADSAAHYRLGPRFFDLTKPVVHFRRLQSAAKPVMLNLLIRFGETVNLGVLEDGQVAYIDVVQSPSALRIDTTPGERNPVHSASLGKAILAFLPEEEVDAIIERHPLIKRTSKTITRKPHFKEHLAQVREQGIAIDLEENLNGVICVAAPIFDQHGRVIASLSVSGPASRMEAKIASIKEEVRSAGLTITRMVGSGSVGRGASGSPKQMPVAESPPAPVSGGEEFSPNKMV